MLNIVMMRRVGMSIAALLTVACTRDLDGPARTPAPRSKIGRAHV